MPATRDSKLVTDAIATDDAHRVAALVNDADPLADDAAVVEPVTTDSARVVIEPVSEHVGMEILDIIDVHTGVRASAFDLVPRSRVTRAVTTLKRVVSDAVA